MSDFAITICPFKALTGIPCPGCGGLRALDMLLHGDIAGALWTNPLSVAVSLFLTASGVWVAGDVVYRIREGREGRARLTWLDFMRRPWPRWAFVLAVVVLLLNWGWNIWKGL